MSREKTTPAASSTSHSTFLAGTANQTFSGKTDKIYTTSKTKCLKWLCEGPKLRAYTISGDSDTYCRYCETDEKEWVDETLDHALRHCPRRQPTVRRVLGQLDNEHITNVINNAAVNIANLFAPPAQYTQKHWDDVTKLVEHTLKPDDDEERVRRITDAGRGLVGCTVIFHCERTRDYRKAVVKGFNHASGRHTFAESDYFPRIPNYLGRQKNLRNIHLDPDQTLYISYDDHNIINSEEFIVPSIPRASASVVGSTSASDAFLLQPN